MHVSHLTAQIRARAVVLYFQPFATIRLERMSAAFGWTVEETEREVVALIQRGEILARVDSQNKVGVLAHMFNLHCTLNNPSGSEGSVNRFTRTVI